ncbi:MULTISPECIES: diguanylate cyclase [unclassified Neptuniibacter]|uniref:putative bifunctional diguanylate cyclase/phosphodiesterase n=1 Tax=unclassified Neptuniibacter TaxID=2630693 RepID=UPI0025FDAA0C|nr:MULTISPECIES: diguanylate cyclase [unclassified Neptuniibacter]|tara:strand:- start:2186 stop:3835 length:1650 start_codon:yes stop_codon:yes gene_type:complete
MIENYAQQLFLYSPQAVIVMDVESKILEVNTAFKQVSGYCLEEVVGQSLHLLSAAKLADDFYETIWLELMNHGSWQGEVWNRHKDGAVYPAWFNVIKISDDSGNHSGYIAQFFNSSYLKSAESTNQQVAQYDELTNLPNWDMFQDILSTRITQSKEANEQLAVMLVDLDRFKWINDNLGRAVGDSLLQEVARRLGSVVRDEDALARLSSDEFVMMLPAVEGVESAIKVAQRVVEQLSHGIFVDHREIFISGSVGISMYPEHAERGKDLVKKADVAMYAAKQGGRNTFRVYSELMERSKGPQILREEDLITALVSNEIQMSYLPVYSIYSHQVVAVHASPYWLHGELGLVSFSDFSALLENPDSIKQYENWLNQELQSLNVIWERFPSLRFISLRIEAQQLNSKDAIQRWVSQLSQHQKSGRLMIDVDIQTALEKEGAVFDLLTSDALLSITGFACESPALEQIRDVQPDFIKIDASLVTTMSNDERRRKIVDSILAIADQLNIEVLADGLSTAGQRGELMGQGCMLMQGPYFGTPLTLAQLLEHLAVEH